MFNTGLRLFRACIHFCTILGIFFLSYKIRLVTDLIPRIHLRIPAIDIQELAIFAGLAGLSFLFIGILKNLYELKKPIQKYPQTFAKVWLYRFITITFIAYFGQSFIFVNGISRLIIVFGSVMTLFALFFFDQIWNYLEAHKHRNSEYKILIIANNISDSYDTIEKVKR